MFAICFLHLSGEPQPAFTQLCINICVLISISFLICDLPSLPPENGMGRPFKQYLSGPRIYSCATCRAHAADHDDIISKAFQGRHGRAYLINNAVNVTLGPKEERVLITGLHTVADIYCTSCNTVLGWKYEHAFEESQKYKEGKYIIEKAKVLKEGNW